MLILAPFKNEGDAEWCPLEASSTSRPMSVIAMSGVPRAPLSAAVIRAMTCVCACAAAPPAGLPPGGPSRDVGGGAPRPGAGDRELGLRPFRRGIADAVKAGWNQIRSSIR